MYQTKPKLCVVKTLEMRGKTCIWYTCLRAGSVYFFEKWPSKSKPITYFYSDVKIHTVMCKGSENEILFRFCSFVCVCFFLLGSCMV